MKLVKAHFISILISFRVELYIFFFPTRKERAINPVALIIFHRSEGPIRLHSRLFPGFLSTHRNCRFLMIKQDCTRDLLSMDKRGVSHHTAENPTRRGV